MVVARPQGPGGQLFSLPRAQITGEVEEEDDWDAIQETLYLLSVPGMRESIKKGMAERLAKSAREVNW